MTESHASSMPDAYAQRIADALHVVDAEEKRAEQKTNGDSLVTFKSKSLVSNAHEGATKNG